MRKRCSRLTLLVVTLVGMLLGAGGSLCQTGPIDGAGGGVIAFVSNRDGTEEIYIMNADGSGQTRVTSNSAFEFDVCWSPVYVVEESGHAAL